MLDPASQAWLRAIQDGNLIEADRLRQVLDTTDQLTAGRPESLELAALTYIKLDIPVFPCEPAGKKPLTPHGFKDASTDPALVTAWWRMWPDANIGAPTGHRFDVFDIDGPHGVRSMFNGTNPPYDHLTENGLILGHARTSRDGGHHLYVKPTGRGNGAAILPGIDYRGIGGYVITPPSIGANGVRYMFTRHLAIE